MYFTYIIQSATTGKYYVGSTQDVAERLRRHNADHSKSTKNKGPWKLLKSFRFDTRSEAMRLEMRKKGRGVSRWLNEMT